MNQKQVTTHFHSAPGVLPTLRQDSPRPKTSSENLVCHALKRLHVKPSISDEVSDKGAFRKIPSPRLGKSRHFTVGQKIDALEQALVHGIPATSRRLNIPSYTLASWRKDLVDGQGRIPVSSQRAMMRNTSGRKLNYSMETDVAGVTNRLTEMRIGKKSLDQLLSSMRVKMGEANFQAKSGHLTDFMTRHGLTLGTKERKAIEDTDTDIRKARMEPPVANDDSREYCDGVSRSDGVAVKPGRVNWPSSAVSDDLSKTEDSDFYCMRG